MEMILKVDGLCKKGILNQVSFEVKKGEMTAIMGPSGSGKSTLLYNISGMDIPDSGSVALNQKELTAMTEDEKADLRLHEMGFVFQQMNMMENLNIIDNILLPAVQANKNKKAGRADKKALTVKAEQLMEKLSIAGLQQRRITEVSGGQLQRACICRSLMNEPKILFADEPTGALNKSASNEVMEALVSLNREGTTILMVTHDSRMASQCGRILYLVDGQIQGELTMNESSTAREREAIVNEWLAGMEW
ncbi:MAG: ABC transporter ATP-binding protein [Lachnospiraceae bacterium]|nr:ABC transporter ATP-binding protein [Lachnospiraceae bacterium]